MSQDFDNEMKGVLFNNTTDKPNAPAIKGECTIGGKTYEIAGWRNTSKAGKTYYSLKFQEPWTGDKGGNGTDNMFPEPEDLA
jgi:uncharacterized protein (DUF736 family)